MNGMSGAAVDSCSTSQLTSLSFCSGFYASRSGNGLHLAAVRIYDDSTRMACATTLGNRRHHRETQKGPQNLQPQLHGTTKPDLEWLSNPEILTKSASKLRLLLFSSCRRKCKDISGRALASAYCQYFWQTRTTKDCVVGP